MAKTSDVADPTFQADLTEAERLLDEGEYSECVRQSVDVYRRLVTERPDIVIVRRPPAELSVTAGRPERPLFAPWPSTLGVTVELDQDQKPVVSFEKDSFMMSEAITYFEYALEAVVRAQEGA
jgi:hypothetical protein